MARNVTQSHQTGELVNPFESPLSSEPSLQPTDAGDWEDQRGRGPVAMFFIGAIMGGIVAAFAGAVGAAMLGTIVGMTGSSRDGAWTFAFFGAIIGAFNGGFFGIIWGAILGIIYGLNKPRAEGLLRLLAISVSALIGMCVGWMGGEMLSSFPGKGPILILTVGTGIVCGGAAGALGGWLLARTLSSLCWSQARVRTTVG